jgi:DNA replication protein DnaC
LQFDQGLSPFGALLPPADLPRLLGELLVAWINDSPRGPPLLCRPGQLTPLPRRPPLLVGATGTGKSFVACALAAHACRKGFRAYYRRAPRLFHDLTLARADGTYVRLLGKLARVDVLLIDDWGLAPVTDQERRDLLEILEDRYGDRSTIITSQLPPAQWHDYLADATLADAICDRILHNAHRLVLKGPSRRKEAKLGD